MSKVLVLESSYESCREDIGQVFTTFPMDLKNKRVVVKVNANKACNPDKEAHATHYKLLEAVLEKIAEMNPKQILVGDSVGTAGYGDTDGVFETLRFREVAGPYYKNFNKSLTLVEIERPVKHRIAVLRDILEADVYISLPKMKTHGLMVITGAMKNNIGLIAGAQKAWFHYSLKDLELFAQLIVEMYQLRKPDLFIMDAIMAMEGYGPASSEIKWVNKILAAEDGVALDTVMAKIAGVPVDRVPYLCIAREMALGKSEMSDIEVIGDASTIPDYKWPTERASSTYSYRSGLDTGRTSREYFRQRIAYRPVISKNLCLQGCFECIDACLFGALSLGVDGPLLNSSLCTSCCACKETCEHGAIELKPDELVLRALIEEETT